MKIGSLDVLSMGFVPKSNFRSDHSDLHLSQMLIGWPLIDHLRQQHRHPGDRPPAHREERVYFIPFLICGLGFPIHPSFLGLPHFYCLQFHHFPPNSILHITCFIMLCEAFFAAGRTSACGANTSASSCKPTSMRHANAVALTSVRSPVPNTWREILLRPTKTGRRSGSTSRV